MLRLRRTSLTALLLVAVTVLAACGAQDPRPAPPRPSSTPTPSPTAPTMPALARQKTDAGAKAFVRYFIGALNFGLRTGSTEGVTASSRDGCKSCTNFSRQIHAVYAHGGSIRGGLFQVETVEVLSGAAAERLVSAVISYDAQVVRTSSAAAPSRRKAGRNILNFRLSWAHSRWRVVDFTKAST